MVYENMTDQDWEQVEDRDRQEMYQNDLAHNISLERLAELTNKPEKVLELSEIDLENLQNYVFLAAQLKNKCLTIGIHL